jgi:hypothetical protein
MKGIGGWLGEGWEEKVKSKKGSTVFNGKSQDLSREFREFARIFETVRENSREFAAKKP